jgi:hypothetical protein
VNYSYYYNQVPGELPWRNNLIYTSLISDDKKTFVQWYVNDSEYHQGQNQVVDPNLMEEKWLREVNYLTQMRNAYPDLVPKIINIDLTARKLYLEIDGPDLWQRSLDSNCSFDEILPDWQEQMLAIIQAHKDLGIYKYSLHPSSYFIVNGKLKSINYFFCYRDLDGPITINSFLSHISENRRIELRKQSQAMGIDWDAPTSLKEIQLLAFESFSNNYPRDFIEKAKQLYV